jgi:hypothetical protein
MCGHSFHPRHAKTACPGAPVWRNGRVGFSFLVYTISKNALAPACRTFDRLGGAQDRRLIEMFSQNLRPDGQSL